MSHPTPRSVAAEYLALYEAEKALKAQKAQAAEALRVAYIRAGITEAVVDGHKVALVPVTTTKVDPDAVADADPDLFAQVSKVSIDLKRWHSAAALGMIDPTLADKAVTESTSDRIEVDAL